MRSGGFVHKQRLEGTHDQGGDYEEDEDEETADPHGSTKTDFSAETTHHDWKDYPS